MTLELIPLLWVVGGLIVGAALCWLIMAARFRATGEAALAKAQGALHAELAVATARAQQAETLLAAKARELLQREADLTTTRTELDRSSDKVAQLGERASRIPTLEANVMALAQAREDALAQLAQGRATAAAMEAQLKAERAGAAEKLALLTQAREAFAHQFKALAADALEANSQRFAQTHQSSLSQILDPLRQKLSDFQAKVEHVYDQENKDRSALQSEVKQMLQMNQMLALQAKELTAALRGSNKAQGNWGEVILERVLEVSGLRKDQDYVVQAHGTDEDGRRRIPDVVIELPEGRRLMVDAKVSLVAYERFANAADEAQQVAALREHLDSVRSHVRGLSERRYERLHGGTFDFVLMFVAVEPAFIAAVNHDAQLFADAWDRNVLLVSPSTLLFVLRSVAHLWRQEQQSRNAQDIANRGAELYDRLVAFVTDLEQVGDHLRRVQKSYDDAHKRLATGKGNVIRQAELLKDLGVKPAKALPSALVDRAVADPEVESLGPGRQADVEAEAKTQPNARSAVGPA